MWRIENPTITLAAEYDFSIRVNICKEVDDL